MEKFVVLCMSVYLFTYLLICPFISRSGLTVESIFQNWLDTSGIPKVNTKCHSQFFLDFFLHFSLHYIFLKSLPQLTAGIFLYKQFRQQLLSTSFYGFSFYQLKVFAPTYCLNKPDKGQILQKVILLLNIVVTWQYTSEHSGGL